MHKTIAIIAVGVLILAGALLYQNGGFKFSIIDGIKPGTWDTAVVTPWKIGNPLVATRSTVCSDTKASVLVILNNPSDDDWNNYKQNGIDMTRSSATFIDPRSGPADVVPILIDEFDGIQNKLPFSFTIPSEFRGIIIAPSPFVHRVKGLSEIQGCDYRYQIYFNEPPITPPPPPPPGRDGAWVIQDNKCTAVAEVATAHQSFASLAACQAYLNDAANLTATILIIILIVLIGGGIFAIRRLK